MSLLMDALKKAQEAKTQARDGGESDVVEKPTKSQSADIDDAEFDSILTKKVVSESSAAQTATPVVKDAPEDSNKDSVEKSELKLESSSDPLAVERPLERSVVKSYSPTADLELSFDMTEAPTRSGEKYDSADGKAFHAESIETADESDCEALAQSTPKAELKSDPVSVPAPQLQSEPVAEPQLTSAICDDVLRDLETDLAKQPTEKSQNSRNERETPSNEAVPTTKAAVDKNSKSEAKSGDKAPPISPNAGIPPLATKPNAAHPRRAANIMSASGKSRRLAPWIRTVLIGGGALLLVAGIGGAYFYDEYQRLVSPNAGLNPPLPQRFDPLTPGSEPDDEIAIEESEINQDMGALTELAQIAPKLAEKAEVPATRSNPSSVSGTATQAPASKTTTASITPEVTQSRESMNVPAQNESSISTAPPPPQQQQVEVPRSKPTPQAIDVKRTVPREDTAYRNLSAGYNAYQSGNFGAATHHYQLVLESMPENRDALLGMAAIYQKNGETAQAKDFYQKVLRLNRNDSVALAGWYGAMNDGDPLSVESELKVLISRQGELPYLHFALGNAYARQNKWVAAEQAFSNAVRADPTNADYAYNYAVSLDQLGRYDSAARYYEAALMQDRGGAAFDREQVQQRLRELREPS